MKLSRTTRDIGVGVGIAVVLLAGLLFFQRHKKQRLAAIAQLETQLKGTDNAPTDSKPVQAKVNDLRGQLKAFADRAPYQPDISVLLADLGGDVPEGPAGDSAGSNAGNGGDREIVMRPTVGGTRLNRNPVVLRMKGPADATMALLQRIEQYRCLTRVSRVYLEKRSPEADVPPLVEIEFTLFSQAAPEALSWDR